MKNLPVDFQNRMKAMLGCEYDAFIAEYDKPPKRGLRVNTLKVSVDEFLKMSPFALAPTGQPREGFVLEGEAVGSGNPARVGTHPYHTAGLYYVQEPSAMLPAALLLPEETTEELKILDMCAAPGGKTGAVAARMRGRGMLVANEYVKSRAKILAGTIERLGITNAVVTSAHPDALADALPEYFDAVIVDAPCSGEGMFRKDDTAIAEWSVEHVATCAARQLGILKSAVRTLRPGGTLVYSTCTFSREENENVVDELMAHCEKQGCPLELMESHRLYPHTSCGEGHFAARLVKRGEAGFAGKREMPVMKLKPLRDKVYDAFVTDTFAAPPHGCAFALKDGRTLLLPFELPAAMEKIYMLSAGVYAGDLKDSRFCPSHALFMAEHGGKYARTLDFSPDDAGLAAFLNGQTIDAPATAKGYAAVAVDGHNVGFGKVSDGILKNHLPKGLRRMG